MHTKYHDCIYEGSSFDCVITVIIITVCLSVVFTNIRWENYTNIKLRLFISKAYRQ